MSKVDDAVRASEMSLQVRHVPMLAHWFLLDSLLLANQANRDGMHANALALTRQCLEALNVIELGISRHQDAEATLAKWDNDSLTPGKLRAWLESHIWPQYGSGIWTESWSIFMREFAAALQPFAHYTAKLAQWQVKLLPKLTSRPKGSMTAMMEIRPRAYDPQKATRITLFHGILAYALGRICLANDSSDPSFRYLVTDFGQALGKSRYLDGHSTDWGQQFWALVWSADGNTILE